MGVYHAGTGDESPKIWSGGSNANCPPPILSCFKISESRLLLSQCSNAVISSSTLTEYSLFPKSTSSMYTKSPPQAENATFSGKDTDKKYRPEYTKTRHFKWNLFFSGEGLSLLSQTPPRWEEIPRSPHPPLTSLLDLPCVPRIPARFTPLAMTTHEARV